MRTRRKFADRPSNKSEQDWRPLPNRRTTPLRPPAVTSDLRGRRAPSRTEEQDTHILVPATAMATLPSFVLGLHVSAARAVQETSLQGHVRVKLCDSHPHQRGPEPAGEAGDAGENQPSHSQGREPASGRPGAVQAPLTPGRVAPGGSEWVSKAGSVCD